MDKHICQRAFSEIEIGADGNVHTCCPNYLKNHPIGNIFNVSSFDEIWYSDKAIELRKHILNNNYDFCNTEICNKKINEEDIKLTERPDYPTLVRFAYDEQCNLKCKICRDSLVFNSEKQIEKYDNMIDTVLLPILKNAKIMSLTSSGEITASEHSQRLLKKAAELYPNLKFELLTNAFLFNEKFCNEMGITEKIDRIVISMHGMTKNTYESIMRGSNFETAKQNIEWILSLKNQKKINEVSIVFVVSSLNYKDLPLFVEFCKTNYANPIIWEYRKLNNTEMSKHFDEYAIWNKKNPEYNNFVKILNKIEKEANNFVRMPELFQNLKPISKYEALKIKLQSFFK